MAIHYFTPEEANAILPQIEPLVGELLERRAKVARASRQIDDRLTDLRLDFAGPEATALSQEFAAIESLVSQIQGFGCVVKSLEAGLVDFLAEMHTGFQGRRRLD